MLRQLMLGLMLATVFTAPVFATTLNGEVSIDHDGSNDQGATINSQTPSMAPSQIQSLPGSNMTIIIQKGDAAPVELKQFMMLMRQNGMSDKIQRLRVERLSGDQSGKMLEGSADQEISALGIGWSFPSEQVIYVDPASDLAGQMVPGDTILAIDGKPPMEAHMAGSNFGDVGTTVQVTFSHNSEVRTVPCKRQPIRNFGSMAQSMLNWRAIGR
jgi:hypothetical protein